MGARPFFYARRMLGSGLREKEMTRNVLVLSTLLLLAGCGGGEEEAGGLSADERQRLENIADRLDEESAEVRELLEASAAPEGEQQASDEAAR